MKLPTLEGKSIFKDKRILILHYRVGRSDGVSIEIEAWKEIFEREGAKVALCAGTESTGANYTIDDFEYSKNPVMKDIDERSYSSTLSKSEVTKLKKDFLQKQKEISTIFENVVKDFKPTTIIISNIFSVGLGLPIAGAITSVIDKYKLQTILVNHDYYWESSRKKNIAIPFIQEQLDNYFPINREYVTNLCINSIQQKDLKGRKGIYSEVLFDTFDYNQRPWEKKGSITNYLRGKGINENDIVVLQATRVVRRKNIETSIKYVSELCKRVNELNGKLYNGKVFNNIKNSIVLVLSGYVDGGSEQYFEELVKYARELGIKLVYLGDDIHKKYELFDIYPYADIITYPSTSEGFGNQLLELIFARKVPILFEYPVFKVNIQNTGLKYVSLGDTFEKDEKGWHIIPEEIYSKAVDKSIEILRKESLYKEITVNNFEMVKIHFGYDNAKRVFEKIILNNKQVNTTTTNIPLITE